MAPSAAKVSNLLDKLEEEDCKTAITFIEYLADRRRKTKEETVRDLFSKFQGVIGEDKGWESEEDMLQDMARFRRERQGYMNENDTTILF